ncbi:Phytochelatin synthase-domain-containing protein [Chytridium lagenaria]|nr:Phytochelatin synthase-domain-containing protein [Chytridium lagenaria]
MTTTTTTAMRILCRCRPSSSPSPSLILQKRSRHAICAASSASSSSSSPSFLCSSSFSPSPSSSVLRGSHAGHCQQCRCSSSTRVLRATMLPMAFDQSINGRYYYTHRPPHPTSTSLSPASNPPPTPSISDQKRNRTLNTSTTTSDHDSTNPEQEFMAVPTSQPFDPATYVAHPSFHISDTTHQTSPIPSSTSFPSTTIPTPQQQQQQQQQQQTQPDMTDKTFYRRDLPPSLTSLNSPSGRLLIKQSLASGYAEAFLQLSGNLAHQSDPAFCGLSSLAMVLNALEIDPKRQWKGVWRWYDETLLDCCAPLEQIKMKGMTFDEFACLARCNGLAVESRSGDQVTLSQFLSDVKSVCSGDGAVQMVVSFSRGTLDQTGDGHFSPIAAFS